MNSSERIDSLTAPQPALALAANSLAPTAEATTSVDVVAPIELRGTRRAQQRVARSGEGLRGRIRVPEPRKDGSAVYLRQLIATATPLVIADLAVLVAAVCLCSLIGLQWLNPADPTSRAMIWIPSVALAWILINAILGLYPGVCLGLVDEIRRLSLSLTVVAIITMARHNIASQWFDDRLLFVTVAYGLCLFMAPVFRSVARKQLAKFDWWGFPTLVCGDDAAAFNVEQWLADNRRLGLRPLGVIADPTVLEINGDSARHLGNWSDAREVAERRHAYWAVMVEPDETAQLTMNSAIDQFLGNIPHVFVVSRLTGIPDRWNRHQMDEGLSGLLVEQHLLLPIPQLVKRGMDLAIATIASLFLAPLFLTLGLAIKLTSPGPVFYGHRRVGKGNTRFQAWKFRTMIANADSLLQDHLARHPELRDEWERDHKLKNDPRVTRLGKWMRKWSIDELPQIWNVFRGEMSIVGPRPIVDAEIVKYGDHFEVFNSVPPGITGLWQVCGRNDTTYAERVQLDVYYVHHWSPWLDLYLLVRTVKTVLFTRGAY